MLLMLGRPNKVRAPEFLMSAYPEMNINQLGEGLL